MGSSPRAGGEAVREAAEGMSVSIGVATNFYNEANALPGFFESVTSWADDIVMVNAGPGGRISDDGSIEIIEKWGARIEYSTIDDGFGVLRSRLVGMTKTDWTVILDCDERLPRIAPLLEFDQEGTVVCVGEYNQHKSLRGICNDFAIDAVVTGRRHWHDFTWNRPTQNWLEIPDWQARIVRNSPHIGYKTETPMHEHIVDFRSGKSPKWYHPDDHQWRDFPHRIVWFDHYHNWFKPMEVDQRQHDIAIYNAIDQGARPPSFEEFLKQRGAQAS